MIRGSPMKVSNKDPFTNLQEGTTFGAVGLSCILGLGISYFGLNARRVLRIVSAR